MKMLNYIPKIKDWDNYVEKSENNHCVNCIFVGDNDEFSNRRLCAETISVIPELSSGFGCCDRYKSCFKWYNQINPIKKLILKKSGFVFKNR